MSTSPYTSPPLDQITHTSSQPLVYSRAPATQDLLRLPPTCTPLRDPQAAERRRHAEIRRQVGTPPGRITRLGPLMIVVPLREQELPQRDGGIPHHHQKPSRPAEELSTAQHDRADGREPSTRRWPSVGGSGRWRVVTQTKDAGMERVHPADVTDVLAPGYRSSTQSPTTDHTVTATSTR